MVSLRFVQLANAAIRSSLSPSAPMTTANGLPLSGEPANTSTCLKSNTGMALAFKRRSSKAYLKYKRSEEHTSELQSLMRNSYAVFCLKKKKKNQNLSHDSDI